MNFKRYLPAQAGIKEVVLAVLILANIAIWTAASLKSPGDTLTVSFLDVGQGDAILVESPNRGRVLIDGGPNRKVLSELGKALPFGDRRIDVVIATHPDADHIGGLVEVVSRYDVGVMIESGSESETTLDDELRNRAQNIKRIIAKRGLTINFGDGAKLVVLYPSEDVTKLDTNDASIVARLDYGEDSFLLTGDAGLRTEQILLNSDPELTDVDVLKAGHHGSHTSTSLPFAQAVSPIYSIISAGLDNRYGHPHRNVVDILTQSSSTILNTATEGTIVFKTDGKKLEIK